MTLFDLAALKEQKSQLESQMAAPGFWENIGEANNMNKRLKSLENKISRYERLTAAADDLGALIEIIEEEDDKSLLDELSLEYSAFKKDVEALRLSTLLKGEYDATNAILSLHAGAGGTEAQDWVQMLYRMYVRYCEERGFTVRELDLLDGDEAGIKSVTFEVAG
ncbi:MAG TPA: PCRF domain-containing protein, partial [Clostridia bacterium]|nr:PCRF domain-containing protein [Clostridia bacterium]